MTECPQCGSKKLEWQTQNRSKSGVQDGRLRLSEVECIFVFGCQECSETLQILTADKVAELMNGPTDAPG